MKRYLIKLTLILAAGFTIGHVATAYDWLWRGDETSLGRLGYHQENDSYVIDSPYTRIAVREFGHFEVGDNLPSPTVGATIHLDSDLESTYSLVDNNYDGQIDGVTWNLGAIDGVAAHPNFFAVRENGSDRSEVVISLADSRQPMHYHVYQDLDRDGKIDTLREVRDGEFGEWHILYDDQWVPATPYSKNQFTYAIRHPENDELIILVQLEGNYWKAIPDEVFTIEEFGLEHEE